MENNKTKKRNKAYAFVQFLANVLSHTIMPVTFHNREQLNMDAPYILIANHQSMLDPLYISYACKKHEIRWLGKKEIAKMPVISWFAKKMDMIHVDRHNTDMAAIRSCMKVLGEGHVLGVFPEGTRHKEGVMEELESGIALIALRSKAPLLPVYLTDKPRLFRRIQIKHQIPLSLYEIPGNRIGYSVIFSFKTAKSPVILRISRKQAFLGFCLRILGKRQQISSRNSSDNGCISVFFIRHSVILMS